MGNHQISLAEAILMHTQNIFWRTNKLNYSRILPIARALFRLYRLLPQINGFMKYGCESVVPIKWKENNSDTVRFGAHCIIVSIYGLSKNVNSDISYSAR